jgi:lactate dehydrogenase-like 2-hydroxyacid dehydrogenase
VTEDSVKAEIVMVGPLMPTVVAALDAAYTVHRLWQAEDQATFLAGIADRVRGVATDGVKGCSAALMDALPKLEVIAVQGVGVDAVDLGHAAKKSIVVTNTPDVLNDDVADLAIGLLIAAARRIPQGDRFVREGGWLKAAYPLQTTVAGKKVGIVGMGRIGREIAVRAEALKTEIAYHSRTKRDDVPWPHHPDLVGMAEWADVLIVIVPGGSATRQMIDARVLRALGPKGILVNVARGSVVDEPALVEALSSGTLGAAALDVFADEPRVPEALLGLDNVVLQPHVGSATVETRAAMGQLVIDNLAAHFAGRSVITPVS